MLVMVELSWHYKKYVIYRKKSIQNTQDMVYCFLRNYKEIEEMSQAKVDKYKEYKANKKEIMKKEKRHNQMLKMLAGSIGVIMIAWLGFSVYNSYEDFIPKEEVVVDYTAVDTFINALE